MYREMRQFDEQITKHLTAQTEHERLLNLVNFKPAIAANNNNNVSHVIKAHSRTAAASPATPATAAQRPQPAPRAHQRRRREGSERERRGRRRKRRRREGKERSTEEGGRAEGEEEGSDERRRMQRRERGGSERRTSSKHERREREHSRDRERSRSRERRTRPSTTNTKHASTPYPRPPRRPRPRRPRLRPTRPTSRPTANDPSRKSDESGKRTQLFSAGKQQTVQALIATLHSKPEKKKKGGKDNSPVAYRAGAGGHARCHHRLCHTCHRRHHHLVSTAPPSPSATLPTPSATSPPLHPPWPTPFPPPATAATGQLVCPPTRQAVHLPPRADDDRVVQQRSALLSTFAFSPAVIRSVMQRAMPADGECSEEAVQLVAQSVCQFIAYITDEAGGGHSHDR